MPQRGKSLVATIIKRIRMPHRGNTKMIEHSMCCPDGASVLFFGGLQGFCRAAAFGVFNPFNFFNPV
jgi:hypothetical protein